MQNGKNADASGVFKKIVIAVLCIASLIAALVCAVTVFLSSQTVKENTLCLFGYKVYYTENGIETANFKKDSLVLVKDSDKDDFYMAEDFLPGNAFCINKLGAFVKNLSPSLAVIIACPFSLLFLVWLLYEIRNVILKKEN